MENEKTGLQKNQTDKLTKYSTESSLIKHQPDRKATVEQIAKMLNQLAKLYQIPNFDGENAVLLSNWIVNNYQYEPLNVVIDCLIKPPSTGENNWRLTPDTIQKWLVIRLEEHVILREKEYQKEKEKQRILESQAPPNFPDFDKLLAGTWFSQAKREENFDEAKYKEVKKEFLNSQKNGNEKQD